MFNHTVERIAYFAEILIVAGIALILLPQYAIVSLVILAIAVVMQRAIENYNNPKSYFFVADPLNPDMKMLADLIKRLLTEASYGKNSVSVMTPFVNVKGEYQRYEVDIRRKKGIFRVSYGDKVIERKLPCKVKLDLPNPLVVCDSRVMLRIACKDGVVRLADNRLWGSRVECLARSDSTFAIFYRLIIALLLVVYLIAREGSSLKLLDFILIAVMPLIVHKLAFFSGRVRAFLVSNWRFFMLLPWYKKASLVAVIAAGMALIMQLA